MGFMMGGTNRQREDKGGQWLSRYDRGETEAIALSLPVKQANAPDSLLGAALIAWK
jgi:hypothetical protein